MEHAALVPRYFDGTVGEAEIAQAIRDKTSAYDEVVLGPLLGSGSFGEVFEGKWRGALVAVKVLEHKGLGSKSSVRVTNEVLIAKHAVHPHVDVERGYLCVLNILLDVIYGLEYLHSIGITHGVTSANCVTLALQGLPTMYQAVFSTGPGSLLYAAPDRLKGGSTAPSGDVYSFGILAWQLMHGQHEQGGMPDVQLMFNVMNKGWRPQFDDTIPAAYVETAQSAWAADPERRPTCKELRTQLTELRQAFLR